MGPDRCNDRVGTFRRKIPGRNPDHQHLRQVLPVDLRYIHDLPEDRSFGPTRKFPVICRWRIIGIVKMCDCPESNRDRIGPGYFSSFIGKHRSSWKSLLWYEVFPWLRDNRLEFFFRLNPWHSISQPFAPLAGRCKVPYQPAGPACGPRLHRWPGTHPFF